ncbi:MAG TPA: glycosyltransferase family 39 protein [Pseudonocardiaceae bacterium]|jgi:4-amino-4-deoxy-L-arabinose transferase-like glycosyltransferase
MSVTTLPVPAPAASVRTRDPKAGFRVGLLVLLAGTAVLYLWDLSASGYANDFYAAAGQAGTQSWRALLFGSLDPGNAITVDKPPASLWVMALSGRIFGFSSWSLLAPQAVEGVLSVWLLVAAVRRWSGPGAGLLAGTALALTPVAALMFRFDNPDALLVLLLVAAAYCVVRATERASAGWLALAGTAVGFAFLTKMLQAFLVLPAFALVYLLAANTSVVRRLVGVAVGGLAVVVSGGWYVALVALWPAGSRPYIGGSSDNSLLQLALGYNGLGRIVGNGGGGPGGANTAFGGATGLGRLFGASMGTEISWLLPAALIATVAGLWFTRRAPRTDRTRAALVLWGGWLVVTGLVFSYMQGTIHPYYTVALAPAVAALVAVAGRELWRGRDQFACRVVLAGMLAATGTWDFVLLARTPDWLPALRWVVLVLAGAAALAVLFGRRSGVGVAALALVGSLLAPAAYTVATAAVPHSGSIPTSGPTTTAFGGGGGPTGQSSPALVAALRASTTRWAAATVGSQSASPLELASGASVLAIGGFTGSDDSPTPAQFEAYVRAGEIHYFVAGGGFGGGGGPGGGSGAAQQITAWVIAHYTATTIGGQTVYDLTT